MPKFQNPQRVVVGWDVLDPEKITAVARYNAQVELSANYINRVKRCRETTEKFAAKSIPVYGINTGLGDNCRFRIESERQKALQQDHLRSHACSVGPSLDPECVRAIILVMISQLGTGHTGISPEIVQALTGMLNKNVTPVVPAEGSVGYICTQAHIGLVVTGEGSAVYEGRRLPASEALSRAGITPVTPGSKEGLSLVSGTPAATALASLALNDLETATLCCDIAGALSFEALGGNTSTLDERLARAKPHPGQIATASNLRRLLKKSRKTGRDPERLQDALSLRSMPQVHGAVKKAVRDASQSIRTEINSSVDNPLVFPEDHEVLPGGNPDGTFIAMAADQLSIAAAHAGKISERRSDRLVNRHVSGLPPFLHPGARGGNGFMVPQYTAAALTSKLRSRAVPAGTDSIPVCALQEDCVSMAYNAARDAMESAMYLRYILAVELLLALQALDMTPERASDAGRGIHGYIRHRIPFLQEDRHLAPDLEWLAGEIKNRRILEEAEKAVGALEF